MEAQYNVVFKAHAANLIHIGAKAVVLKSGAGGSDIARKRPHKWVSVIGANLVFKQFLVAEENGRETRTTRERQFISTSQDYKRIMVASPSTKWTATSGCLKAFASHDMIGE